MYILNCFRISPCTKLFTFQYFSTIHKMKNLKPGKGPRGRQHSGNSESDAPTSSLMPSGQMGEQTAMTNVSKA